MSTAVPASRSQVEAPSHHSFPVFRVIDETPKNALERMLSVFADVRAGEGVTRLLRLSMGEEEVHWRRAPSFNSVSCASSRAPARQQACAFKGG